MYVMVRGAGVCCGLFLLAAGVSMVTGGDPLLQEDYCCGWELYCCWGVNCCWDRSTVEEGVHCWRRGLLLLLADGRVYLCWLLEDLLLDLLFLGRVVVRDYVVAINKFHTNST